MKTIKEIELKNFTVTLSEAEEGYLVSWIHLKITKSKLLHDYHTASYLFDLKVQELEGQ